MISVSQNFLDSIGKPVETAVSGTITMPVEDGTLYTANWNTENVISGSFSVSDKCIKGSGFSIGAVNSSTLTATMHLPDYSATNLLGAKIAAFYGVATDSGFEQIPLGVFKITKSSPQADNLIQITAVTALYFANMYDSNDPEALPAKTLCTPQKPYDIFVYLCSRAGLEFGNTAEEVEAMPNGTELFSMPEDSTVSTTTDCLSYLATCLGGFVTCDRLTGKIIIKHFGTTPTATLALNKIYRGSLSIAGFSMELAKVAVTFYENGAFSSYAAVGLEELTGNPNNIVVDITDNPFMEGLYFSNSKDLEYIVNRLREIGDKIIVVPYKPFSCSYAGNPAIEVGDCVEVQQTDGTYITTVVSSYNFTFRGRHVLRCDGEDARLTGGIKINEVARLEKKLNRRINQTVPTHTTQSQFDTDYSNGKLRDGLYIIDEEVQNG